ncbi:hypothetical protein HPP92_020208 [Vanilla planifolia]|uniref:Uncharacterized protein n=1 Tax=Vanilla planifolia TaxID=51239 RepID=A0A835UI95_VANPL|nr:hypothetical protein HPP92_020208 [Vanilla planifolia]
MDGGAEADLLLPSGERGVPGGRAQKAVEVSNDGWFRCSQDRWDDLADAVTGSLLLDLRM